MRKLFVFAIGGSGARVLKSLTMLLAAGVEAKDTTIVPLIIDPDLANGDTNRTADMLSKYVTLRTKLNGAGEFSFFKTEIQSFSINNTAPKDFVKNDMISTQAQTFGQFIDYDNLDEVNKAFVDLLYSEKNRNADLTVGFKGNPNMGSIVLNQFASILDNLTINAGDAIFIVSSIFGGTGAAGFPLLVKNIKVRADQKFVGIPIGALSILPYFHVNNIDETPTVIDSDTFLSKTTAALHYYNRSLNDNINALYYIGDKPNTKHQGAEGGAKQQNDAHFIELAGALAIVHFVEKISADNNNATKVFEFGIEDDNGQPLRLNSLSIQTQNLIKKPLVKFLWFMWYMKYQYNIDEKSNRVAYINNDKNIGFRRRDIATDVLSSLEGGDFWQAFEKWLSELSKTFNPFDMYILRGAEVNGNTTTPDNIGRILNNLDEKINKGFKLFPKSNRISIDDFINEMNKQVKLLPDRDSTNLLCCLVDKVTEKLYEKL
ncbi:MAG: hypothetical protein QM528_05130 [Phycisphaerales bacterium]|nr:hypothetical protein [Phycisphaerales bacterium]